MARVGRMVGVEHARHPARDPLAIAAYLAERVADGAAAATVRTIRAAIRAGHVDTGADDPTGHDGVRRVLHGLTRQAAGRGRGQADPLTADDVAAIMATASIPRRTGMQPTGAPPIGRLSPCCSRVACAGRKRRRCAGRTCRKRRRRYLPVAGAAA